MDGLCEYHTEHNEECGYAEDTPCAFVCGECEEYTSETFTGEEGQEETVWPSTGEYLFTAQVGEGYIFEESPSLTVGLSAPMMTTFALTSAQTGWDEETRTYTVIGTDGYPDVDHVQELETGAILDRSQAESYTLPDGTTSHSNLMFQAKGDLTIIGPENGELTFERCSLISMPEWATLTPEGTFIKIKKAITGPFFCKEKDGQEKSERGTAHEKASFTYYIGAGALFTYHAAAGDGQRSGPAGNSGRRAKAG